MKKIIFLIMLIMLFLTSCISSPETEIVKSKISAIDDTVEESAVCAEYSVPSGWNEEIEVDNLIISIDANITVPKVDMYPIVSITQKQFTQEEVDHFIDVLFKGSPLYEMDDVMTKGEIEGEIVYLKSKLVKYKKESPDLAEEYDKVYNEKIENLKKQLLGAPEEYQRKLLDTNISNSANMLPQGNVIVAEGLKGEEKEKAEENAEKFAEMLRTTKFKRLLGKAFINPGYSTTLSMNIDSKNNSIKYVNSPGGVQAQNLNGYEVSPRGMEMNLDEAKKTAEKFILDLGIDYMNVAFIDIGTKYYEILNFDERETEPQCYIFYFTRSVNDIPVTYEETVSSDSGGMAPSNFYEYLRLDVDDNGVIFMNWKAPTIIIDELYKNTKLLPYKQIQDIAKQQIIIENTWNEDSGIVSREIHINRIQLGFVRIAEKNESEEYLLVPAWDFFGYSINESNDGSIITNEDIAKSYLTINAIDGTIIDRLLGY